MTKPSRFRPYAGREIAPFTAADIITRPGAAPTVLDLTLADRLGFQRPSNIRNVIKRNRDEIESFGTLLQAEAKSTGGRPGAAFALNRQQAIAVTILAKTSIAAKVRKQIVEVFDAVASGAAPPAAPLGALIAHETATKGDLANVIIGLGRVLDSVHALTRRLHAWEDAGFSGEPAAAKKGTIEAFVSSALVADPTGKVQARTLYGIWRGYAAAAGVDVGSEKHFAARMADHIGPSRRAMIDGRDCVAYYGFRLTASAPLPAAGAASAAPATPVLPAPPVAPVDPDDMLFGYAAIGGFLGVTAKSASRLKARHGLPTFKIGARLCAARPDIREWLGQRRAAS